MCLYSLSAKGAFNFVLGIKINTLNELRIQMQELGTIRTVEDLNLVDLNHY